MLKKKIKKKIILALAPVVLIGAVVIVIVCALVTLDFFGTNETDGYVEENEAYAEDYKNVLNQNIKYGNGYVSLSRILYFYLEDDQLSFSMIYSDNLDKETKKQKPISEVCEMPRYKSMSVCKTEEQVYAYNNSAYGIMDAMNNDYNNLNFDIEKLTKEIGNKENVQLLDQVLTKLG